MHREGKRYGLIYQSLPPFEVLASACLPYSDLLKLKSVEEMVEIYYNSGQFTYSIGYLETLFPTPFDLFEALGEYYEKKGLSILQHARMTKYNILIDFYHDTFQEVPLTFKLLLLIDLYLQENLKKRPTWYEENNQFKEAIKKFYNNPVLRQKYLPEYAEYEGKQVQRMTHIEPIPIDLSRWLFKTKEKQGPSFLLFNYAKRDPLTHHATMSFLSTLT